MSRAEYDKLFVEARAALDVLGAKYEALQDALGVEAEKSFLRVDPNRPNTPIRVKDAWCAERGMIVGLDGKPFNADGYTPDYHAARARVAHAERAYERAFNAYQEAARSRDAAAAYALAEAQTKTAETQAKAAEAMTKSAEEQAKAAQTQATAANTQATAADTQASVAKWIRVLTVGLFIVGTVQAAGSIAQCQQGRSTGSVAGDASCDAAAAVSSPTGLIEAQAEGPGDAAAHNSDTGSSTPPAATRGRD